MAGGISRPRELFEREALPYLDALFTAAMHLTHEEAHAKDLCQETMLRAYHCLYQFTPGTNCRAWLLTILYNVFRSGYRRGQREQVMANPKEFERAVDAESASAHPEVRGPEALLFDEVSHREVNQALEDLPEDFRDALLLVDIQDLKYQDAAEVLQVPIGTVRSRVSRARTLMRAALQHLARRRGRAA